MLLLAYGPRLHNPLNNRTTADATVRHYTAHSPTKARSSMVTTYIWRVSEKVAAAAPLESANGCGYVARGLAATSG